MWISGRNTPRNDRWSSFKSADKDCFEEKQRGRQRQKGDIILIHSKRKRLSVVTSSAFLIPLVLLLQNHWHSVFANREMSSNIPRRSLSFVAGRNGHRSYSLMPWSSSQSLSPFPSEALPKVPIIRMEAERHKARSNSQQEQPTRPNWRLYASSSSSTDSVGGSLSNATKFTDQSMNPQGTKEKFRSDLEDYRMQQSKFLNKSPSVLLPDKVMDGICALDPLPSTIQDLSQVRGLGPKKLELFGTGILDLVASCTTPKTTTSVQEKGKTKKEVETFDSPVTNDTSSSTRSGGIEDASPPKQSGGSTTLRSSSSSTISESIIQTGVEEKSRYSNQIGSNQSFVKQQHRSNSSSTAAMSDASNDSKKENEASGSSIAKEETEQNLQQPVRQNDLRSNLQDYRTEQSKILGKSPSMILPDKVIDGICSLDPPPTSMEDLSKVKGLGVKKLEQFGESILSLLSSETTKVATEKPPADDDSLATEVSKDASSGVANAKDEIETLPLAPLTATSRDNIDTPEEHIISAPYSEISAEEIDDFPSSFDSFVAPAPYSAPDDDFDVAPLDSFFAPAPYSAPKGNTGFGTLDSYVAPAPFSFADEDDEEYDDDDEFEEEIISEESFGTAHSTPTNDIKAEDTKTEEKEKMTTTKLRKTQLKKDLKDYRLEQKDSGKPAYTVFTNAALDGIYAALPVTHSELLAVKGIGPKKLDLYGDDILEIVAPYAGLGGKKEQSNTSSDTSTPQSNTSSDTSSFVQREKIDPEGLTDEQRKAADMIFGNEDDLFDSRPNVFVTGQAGTGKSHLLKYVVETLQWRKNLNVGVCAPTGVAAVIVGGSTLHSFFGIGLGKGTKSTLLRKVRDNHPAKKRIEETDVLIIDECSMLSAELLETLDMVARNIRKDGMLLDQPFGGMQIVAFGDFFQLPPIHRYDGEHDRSWRPFCFDSPVWSELGLSENAIELREVQRQEEGDFVDLLNRIRVGRVDQGDIFGLNQKCLVGPNNPLPNDGILPTRLYVLNRDVDEENSMRLKELSGKEVVCRAKDFWRQKMPRGTPASVKQRMKESLSMQMPDEVRLKVGAQVMLTRNKDLERNLVNGSRGVVERFEIDRDLNRVPVVRFDSGITLRVDPVEFMRQNTDGGEGLLVRKQVPLKLAWAVTIHKSQGSTLTRASLDLTSAFEYGQCYVALSRVRSLEGLWLERPAELRDIMVSPQVMNFFSDIF